MSKQFNFKHQGLLSLRTFQCQASCGQASCGFISPGSLTSKDMWGALGPTILNTEYFHIYEKKHFWNNVHMTTRLFSEYYPKFPQFQLMLVLGYQ